MVKKNVQAIILAAGKSNRLKTGQNKLLEHICGQPMIIFATKLFESLGITTTVVIGHQKELIKKCINKYHSDTHLISFAVQPQQQGTAHALKCTEEYWQKDHILIMNGDMPLVTPEIIEALYKKHLESDATLSFVMAHYTDPNTSYGRVIKKDNKIKIIEANEFTGDINDHCCINAGIYLIKRTFLEKNMHTIQQNEKSKEFHITDLVARASEQSVTIATTSAPFDYVRGINNQHELWAAEQIKRSNIIKYWMEHGVRFSVAHNVHIDLDVTIGAGSYIGCGVHLLYGTTIGEYCKIHEYVTLEAANIGNQSVVYPFSIIKSTTIGKKTEIGPFAHIRDNSYIADNAVIGNFVEIKQSTLGTSTKAKHLSYIGDATIGNETNIGAGTITCNFDGKKKHQTVIEDHVFIGSNNTLIAPITIGKGAFTAGGSTITHDVPAGALAIARNKQMNKQNYAKKFYSEEQEADNKNGEEFFGATRTTNDVTLENDSR